MFCSKRFFFLCLYSQLSERNALLWFAGNTLLWPGWESSDGGECSCFHFSPLHVIVIIEVGWYRMFNGASWFEEVIYCRTPVMSSSVPSAVRLYCDEHVMRCDTMVTHWMTEEHQRYYVRAVTASGGAFVADALIILIWHSGTGTCSDSRWCLVRPRCSPCLWDESRGG